MPKLYRGRRKMAKTKEPKVIAILTADWHLSHKPPVWRSNEPDWYAAMERPLDEVQTLQRKYNCPVLIAGDVFELWYGATDKSATQLINWASNCVPIETYSIAGQHDIPNHNWAELNKSAYWSLLRNKAIKENIPESGKDFEGATVWGFHYGNPLRELSAKVRKQYPKNRLHIALVHDYICTTHTDYPKAPTSAYIHRIRKDRKGMVNGRYFGYDVVVYGDNHKGFSAHIGRTTIFNCGSLMRRASNEEEYKPRVGLLYTNREIELRYLDISKDKHLTADEVKDVEDYEQIDMELFAKELRKLGASALEFKEAMKQFWRKDKTRKAVINIIMKAMEKQL
jgi:DNA repair exonuclease SbcCD nuclease subunit